MKKCRLFIFSIIAFVAGLFLTSNVFAYYVGEDVGTYVHDSGKRYNQQVVYNKYAII